MVKLPVSKGNVCVVGDEYFTLGFALGGAGERYIVSVNAPKDEVLKTLNTVVNNLSKKGITLVIVQDKLKPYFEKVRQSLSKGIVVYVPDITSASKAEVKEYYSSLIRRYLGIALELG